MDVKLSSNFIMMRSKSIEMVVVDNLCLECKPKGSRAKGKEDAE